MVSFLRHNGGHFVATLITLTCTSSLLLGSDLTKYRFQEARRSDVVLQVQSVLELAGELKFNPDGKQVIKVPLSGKGELLYDERPLASNEPTVRRAVRFYRATNASSRVGERDVVTRLADDHRLIGVQATAGEVTLFCPLGPLTRDELELLDVQGSTLLAGQLLPSQEVTVNETWTHDDGLAAALFKLDVVTENQLHSVLKRVENNTAYLELSGTLQGSVAGVDSKLEVAAKYNFDLKAQRISWFAMSFKEDRAVGHAEPGFELTARLRTSIGASPGCPELADEAVAQLPLVPDVGTRMLLFNSAVAGLRFVHDRGWQVMVDRNDVIILRLVERGELIAQCNISRLPEAAAGKQLSMASFQTDIQRVLDKNFGQFVANKESQNEQGMRMLRTTVSGVASDLPIQWTYYHLTSREGHQASMVFTLDAKLLERFAAADQTIVESFEFVEPAESGPAGATPRAEATPKTAQSSGANVRRPERQ